MYLLMSGCLFTYGTLQPNHAPEEIASTLAQLRFVDKGFVGSSALSVQGGEGKLDEFDTLKLWANILIL
jgi:hypothetical protein